MSHKTPPPPKALSSGISALSILPDLSPSTWNPEQILCLYNYEIHRWSCLGLTNKSSRCRGDPIWALRSRESAIDVVLRNILPDASGDEHRFLEGLAHNILCHPHRSKAAIDDLVEGWKMVLQKARQTFNDQQNMERQLRERQSNMKPERGRGRMILLPRSVSGAAPRASSKSPASVKSEAAYVNFVGQGYYIGDELIIERNPSDWESPDSEATSHSPTTPTAKPNPSDSEP
jgi:hypothetical protein